jgi:hypothetical protein
LQLTEHELQVRFETIRQKLFAVREQRVHPHKDDKILTDWNGLMIAALARAAQVFTVPAYAEAARRAVSFILKTLRTPDGRLLHRFRDGEAAVAGMVDDYAFFIWGLLELYEATFDAAYLQTALDLQQSMLKHFWDDTAGGFFFTADDAEALLLRQKEIYDGAIPSGNAVAMLNLLRLSRITAQPDFEQKALIIARAFAASVQQVPSAYTQFLVALDFAVNQSAEVVIAGKTHASDTKDLLNAVRKAFVPNKIVLLRPAEQNAPAITAIAPYTKELTELDGRAAAYVCRNFTCSRPATSAEQLLELLAIKK